MVTTTTKISLGYELDLVQSSPIQNAILHVCQNLGISEFHSFVGSVDFDLNFPLACPTGQPLLTNSYQARQKRADNGMLQIKVNTTQLHDQMKHPVHQHHQQAATNCCIFSRLSSPHSSLGPRFWVGGGGGGSTATRKVFI